MISFVCWKWNTEGRRRHFHSQHVNVLEAMVSRHYPEPHRFICVTDDPQGLAPSIEAVPMPVRFDHLLSPHGERFPSCYARLWNFSREARAVLGERIFCLDIDLVVVADLRPLVARHEAFVGWCDERFKWNKIAGGAYLMTTGAMTHVWDRFDPEVSPGLALAAGNNGSDQGWMSHCMYPPLGRWSAVDGLVKINWCPTGMGAPPLGVRIAFNSGKSPPWSTAEQQEYPWIRDHWRL